LNRAKQVRGYNDTQQVYCRHGRTLHPKLHVAAPHALYRLTARAAIPNVEPRFNVCPTDPADV
jgi:hypothetical protein